MPNWLEMDIRRTLPEYRQREGDDVYNAPYRATEVDLNAFVLDADPLILANLVDEQLNAVLANRHLIGSQQELRFGCSEGWIVVIFASFRSLGSSDRRDRSQGSVGALELSIWVPIFKQHRVSGTVVNKPAWFLPLVYTAPTASVATGREVYGYPKVPAFLADAGDAGGPPHSVEIARSAAGRTGSPARPFNVAGAPVVPPAGWDASILEQPLMRSVVGRFFSNLPLIFRKQVGIRGNANDPKLRAGYTALIEAKVPITRIGSLTAIRPDNPAGALDVLDASVTKLLGIRSTNPLQGAAVRGCSLDIQQGHEIWVAANEVEYIAPMAAAGNGLMRGFPAAHAFDVFQVASASSSASQSAPKAKGPLLEIHDAVGEAFFAQPRPKAIAALLTRHFPNDQPRPSPDPDRQFIVLSLLRASLANGEVLLFEASVWVPIKLDGQEAWYIPYMFRSPGAAVIHAREWFGHPCQQGFVEFDPAAPRRSVSMTRPVAIDGSVRWRKDTGIVIDLVEERPAYDWLPPLTEQAEGRATGFYNGQQQLVGLLQVRHAADTSRACFQEVVTSTLTMQAERQTAILGRISLQSGLRLGRLLDLEAGKDIVPGHRFTQLSVHSTLPRKLTLAAAAPVTAAAKRSSSR